MNKEIEALAKAAAPYVEAGMSLEGALQKVLADQRDFVTRMLQMERNEPAKFKRINRRIASQIWHQAQ